MSLGRVHKLGLTAKLPPDGLPLLLDEYDNVVLQGEYVLSMPCFRMCAVRDFLLLRTEVAVDSVYVVTRSMNEKSVKVRKKGKKKDVWSGDPSRILPQKSLNDQEKMILFHNRMGHVFNKKLVDGYMRMLYSGYSIPRSMIGQKALTLLPKC